MPLRLGGHRVSAKHPCPMCGKGDCSAVCADGRLAACRRNVAGAWKEKTTNAGTAIYLHRLDGAATMLTAEMPPVAMDVGGNALCFVTGEPSVRPIDVFFRPTRGQGDAGGQAQKECDAR